MKQNGLTWTFESSRLSAESFGYPADEIVMVCGVGALRDNGLKWKRVKALWDTGTSTTIITPTVAAMLGLEPEEKDFMDLNGIGGVVRAWTSVVYIGLPNGKAWGPVSVAVRELPSTDVLLGMDIISIGKFTIERKPDGGTRFTFDLNL